MFGRVGTRRGLERNALVGSSARGSERALSLASLLTTWSTLAYVSSRVWSDGVGWSAGAEFAAYFLAFLGVHELGHLFLQSGKPRWPIFIPEPFALGTLGAIITGRHAVSVREAVAGPLAGMGLALLYWFAPVGEGSGVAIRAPFWLPAATMESPLAMAGRLAALVTFANLLPIRPLDGGRAFLPLVQHPVRWELGAFVLLLLAGFVWPGWWLWAAGVAIIRRGTHDLAEPSPWGWAVPVLWVLTIPALVPVS